MVVDLAVDGEGDGFVVGEDGLRAGVDADDGEAFVDEDRRVRRVVAAPIGSPVLDLLTHADSGRAELLDIGVAVGREQSMSVVIL